MASLSENSLVREQNVPYAFSFIPVFVVHSCVSQVILHGNINSQFSAFFISLYVHKNVILQLKKMCSVAHFLLRSAI